MMGEGGECSQHRDDGLGKNCGMEALAVTRRTKNRVRDCEIEGENTMIKGHDQRRNFWISWPLESQGKIKGMTISSCS